ncbi:MaoC family dehydratase [Nesterenkonia flava]|uniref:MaoC family dehydratase n=1 Tax=Nesterenkonia flava TaxID=469799 RepID=A0ABU1FU41_9MICC|nr:MaoC family dehydratase [Nesterenkonia flava]MDR5712133.1 MaoC family dehydratase [Nesterenkonia flava]
MSRPTLDQLEKGQSIGSRTVELSRADLLRYAAASGDHNPIHWNERFAREVGLEGVIAHGMLTMGIAADLAVEWASDPGAIIDYQTRFTKPVPVPDAPAGSPETPTAVLEVTGKIGALNPDDVTARVDLTVELISTDEAGEQTRTKVLAKTQALVKLQ